MVRDPRPLPAQYVGASALTDTQASAFDIFQQVLKEYGLGELANWAYDQIANGTTPSNLELQLYDPSTEPGKVVARIYPELQEIKQSGRPPINIQNAIDWRKGANDIFASAHLPPGFWDDQTQLGELHGKGLSLTELNQRVTNGIVKAMQAPPEVQTAYNNYFGTNGIGALASQFLDPTLSDTVLQQHLAAAQVGGAGSRYGYALSAEQAQKIADYGVGYSQAAQGFQQVGNEAALFNPLAGEQGQNITAETGINAALLGDPNAQRDIERRAQQRQAAFAGQGDLMTTAKGVVGLGNAEQPR